MYYSLFVTSALRLIYMLHWFGYIMTASPLFAQETRYWKSNDAAMSRLPPAASNDLMAASLVVPNPTSIEI